jgi:hypothetical protein
MLILLASVIYPVDHEQRGFIIDDVSLLGDPFFFWHISQFQKIAGIA